MIYVIGIGASGRATLSKRSLGIINRAGVVAGGARHLKEFPGLPGRMVPVKGGLEKTARAMEGYISGRKALGKRAVVAVFATGDPSLFGIASFMVKRFGKRSVEIIPNVSIVQEAFARIKEDWCGLKILSAHGRGAANLMGEIGVSAKAAVFTDSKNTPASIARTLVSRGVSGYTVYVFEDLGMESEKITRGTLKSVAARRSFRDLNLMVLLKDKGAPPGPGRYSPGIPDREFFHPSGMITKVDIRVLALSRMRLERDSVVWDIGAGSGSVAVEAALIADSGTVYAIEKNAKRVRDILRNRERFRAWNLEVINGRAPGCLKARSLPAPDAVFVGGGGKDLSAILDHVAKRIKTGGRVVVNAVTIETAYRAFAFFKANGFSREMTLVGVSKVRAPGSTRGMAKAASGLNMLSADNPVFIIVGTRDHDGRS